MKRFNIVLIISIMLSVSSCAFDFDNDMHGEGIDKCEISFVTDNSGNINCRALISKYFTESEIRILDKRVRSISIVELNTDIFGRTIWWYNPVADIAGNDKYSCEIILNIKLFDKVYNDNSSDAKLYMLQVTLLHELCHVLWSDPDIPPVDETVDSEVSREGGHNETWYHSFKEKVMKFVSNNQMQKFRIKSALEKYGYEKFGPEYNYIPGCRALNIIDEHCDCDSCGGVIYMN